ncbi:MAG: hypothetical protein ABSG62_10150 [Terracidiphilus sp.]|jgi:hypothetical protein
MPFFAPGFFAAAIVFSTGIHSDHPIAYLALATVLNVAFTWIALLLILMMIEKRITRTNLKTGN